ncbi:MAG: hypothetical protein ABSB63_23190 [Spirochaetia bacterium]|jgi:hypothetical protein
MGGGGYIRYTCSASCGKNTVYGNRPGQSYFFFNFRDFAEKNPEYVEAHGRHGPAEVPCPGCGAPAYKEGSKPLREMETRDRETRRVQEESKRAVEDRGIAAQLSGAIAYWRGGAESGYLFRHGKEYLVCLDVCGHELFSMPCPVERARSLFAKWRKLVEEEEAFPPASLAHKILEFANALGKVSGHS